MLETITIFRAITLWKGLISNLLGSGVGVGVGVGDSDGNGPTMMIYFWRSTTTLGVLLAMQGILSSIAPD